MLNAGFRGAPHTSQYFIDQGGAVIRLVDPNNVLPRIPSGNWIQIQAKTHNTKDNIIVVRKVRQIRAKNGGSQSSVHSKGVDSKDSPSPPPSSPLNGETEPITAADLEGDMIAVGAGNIVWAGGSSLFRGQSDVSKPFIPVADGQSAPSFPPPVSSNVKNNRSQEQKDGSGKVATADASDRPPGSIYSTTPRVVTDMSTVFYIMDFCGLGGGPVATVEVRACMAVLH